MTPKEALDLEFDCSDLAATVTIRQYFKELLITLYEEGEGFSGKRPFGNSGWEWDIASPLIKAGLVTGAVDEDGYVEEVNSGELASFTANMINAL